MSKVKFVTFAVLVGIAAANLKYVEGSKANSNAGKKSDEGYYLATEIDKEYNFEEASEESDEWYGLDEDDYANSEEDCLEPDGEPEYEKIYNTGSGTGFVSSAAAAAAETSAGSYDEQHEARSASSTGEYGVFGERDGGRPGVGSVFATEDQAQAQALAHASVATAKATAQAQAAVKTKHAASSAGKNGAEQEASYASSAAAVTVTVSSSTGRHSKKLPSEAKRFQTTAAAVKTKHAESSAGKNVTEQGASNASSAAAAAAAVSSSTVRYSEQLQSEAKHPSRDWRSGEAEYEKIYNTGSGTGFVSSAAAAAAETSAGSYDVQHEARSASSTGGYGLFGERNGGRPGVGSVFGIEYQAQAQAQAQVSATAAEASAQALAAVKTELAESSVGKNGAKQGASYASSAAAAATAVKSSESKYSKQLRSKAKHPSRDIYSKEAEARAYTAEKKARLASITAVAAEKAISGRYDKRPEAISAFSAGGYGLYGERNGGLPGVGSVFGIEYQAQAQAEAQVSAIAAEASAQAQAAVKTEHAESSAGKKAILGRYDERPEAISAFSAGGYGLFGERNGGLPGVGSVFGIEYQAQAQAEAQVSAIAAEASAQAQAAVKTEHAESSAGKKAILGRYDERSEAISAFNAGGYGLFGERNGGRPGVGSVFSIEDQAQAQSQTQAAAAAKATAQTRAKAQAQIQGLAAAQAQVQAAAHDISSRSNAGGFHAYDSSYGRGAKYVSPGSGSGFGLKLGAGATQVSKLEGAEVKALESEALNIMSKLKGHEVNGK